MDLQEWVKTISAELPEVNKQDLQRAIEIETDAEQSDGFLGRRKPRLSVAQDTAAKRVRDWLVTATEYQVKLNHADLANFAIGHRRSCVWAVLTGKAIAEQRAGNYDNRLADLLAKQGCY